MPARFYFQWKSVDSTLCHTKLKIKKRMFDLNSEWMLKQIKIIDPK